MKMRIAIVGIGGVGGYLGARLCCFRKPQKPYHVVFIQRGEGLLALKKNGITLVTDKNTYTSFPDMTTEDPSDLGVFSHVMFCVKSYQLEEALRLTKNIIDKNTVIVPLLNGIEVKKKVETSYPFAKVMDGCIYVSSEVIYPGVVRQTGSAGYLYFGAQNSSESEHRVFLDILKNARIKTVFEKNMKRRIWEKFLLLCPFATLSSYYNCTAGDIADSAERKREFVFLMKEIISLAESKGIILGEKDIRANLEKISLFSKNTKTSFQRDIEFGRKTEIDVLTGYVVQETKKMNLEAPVHAFFYEKLLER
ncbi:2-dehydropantoate 2-reductase [candidate division WOR-3 bacterium]|nr:2-dehydropantoate 2-reductase [candidate division WOR-3 bacterium]